MISSPKQFREQLGGDVLVFEPAHFGEELIGQDADVWLLQSGGLKDVDDLAFGRDCLCDELPDGVIEFFGCLAFAALAWPARL